jgi:hypothetical protein
MTTRRFDLLAWAALLAALAVTASGEWALAHQCGMDRWVAAGVPASLDIYAVRAMRARRDVRYVVGAMIGVQAAAHLVASGHLTVSPGLVVAVSAIAPLVLWRVHLLADEAAAEAERDTRQAAGDTVASPASVEVSRATADELLPAAESSQATGEGHQGHPGVPPAPERPAIEAAPPAEAAAADPVVICGGTPADPLPIPDVPQRPRLDTEAARAAIEAAWRDGLSVRQAAARATRSPAQVQRVYAALDAAHGGEVAA